MVAGACRSARPGPGDRDRTSSLEDGSEDVRLLEAILRGRGKLTRGQAGLAERSGTRRPGVLTLWARGRTTRRGRLSPDARNYLSGQVWPRIRTRSRPVLSFPAPRRPARCNSG